MSGTDNPFTKVGDLDRLACLGCSAIDDIAGEDPRMAGGDAVRRLAIDLDDVHQTAASRPRNSCSAATRSSVGGCVENNFMNAEPLNGLMMNM